MGGRTARRADRRRARVRPIGLLDDIKAETVVERRCSVAELIDELPDKDADDLRAALADSTIAHTVITRVLIARGYDMHDKRLAAHRNGHCACARR